MNSSRQARRVSKIGGPAGGREKGGGSRSSSRVVGVREENVDELLTGEPRPKERVVAKMREQADGTTPIRDGAVVEGVGMHAR